MSKIGTFIVIALCCFVCALCIVGNALAQENGIRKLTVEEELVSWLMREREARHIPGMGFALVKNGKLISAKGIGGADLSAKKSVTEETVFRVGSVSKPVTATALLHLIENSDLALDSDLRPLLQDLPVRPPLEEPLTPHHLLTHTCGLNERLFGQHARRPEDYQRLGDYLVEHLPPRFEEPGRVISYNDYCTSLVGFVIEEVSGTSFHDYVKSHVFSPLGMEASTFDQLAEERGFPDGLARSYRWHEGVHTAYDRDYIMTSPAAGLYTNARDMGAYLVHLLADDGEKMLSAQSLSSQKAVQFTHHEKLTGRAYGFASMRYRGFDVFYKDGQAMGFSARLVIVPETGDGFFVVQNRSIFGPMGAPNEAGRLTRDLTNFFLERLFSESKTSGEAVAPTPRNATMSAYVGSYRNVVAARHSFEKIISLMDDIIVESPEPGVITYGSQKYVEIEDGLFQWHEGGPYYLVFDKQDGHKAQYLFIGGGAYERVLAVSNSKWAPRILSGLLGVTLFGLIAALVLALRRMPSYGLARKLMLSSILKIVGVAGVGAVFYMSDLQMFFFGPPLSLTVLLALPLLAFALDAWVLGTGVRALKETGRTFKALVILHTTAALGLLWWLDDWNLLGWRCG